MFCKMCGKEIPEESLFCSKCGAAVTSYETISNDIVTTTNNKKKKIHAIVALVTAAIFVLCACVIVIIFNLPSNRYKKHLDLGNKFFKTMDFTEAEAEFKKAINIDPKRPEAYLRLAETYIEQELPKEAELVLNAGYFMTQNSEIVEKALQLGCVLIGINDNSEYDIQQTITNEQELEITVSVPDLIGLDIDTASRLLSENTLSESITYEESEEYDEGYIVSQDITPGSQVEKNTSISIVVSSGKPVTEFSYDDYEEGYNPGMIFPDFTMTDMDGNPVNLNDYRGKSLYLNFFTTWCPYCFYEIPDMKEVSSKYGDDVTILLVDLGEDATLASEYASEYDISFQINHLPDWNVGAHQVEGVPESFVLDKHGIIVDYIEGMTSFEWMDAAVSSAISIE